MAYVSKEKAKEIKEGVKAWSKKYNFRTSVRVEHHSGIRVVVREGDHPYFDCNISINCRGNYVRIPKGDIGFEKFIESTGQEMWLELQAILSKGNWDRSDLMQDYFDIGWYTYIDIGAWDKPYIMRNSMSYCSCGLELLKDKCPEHGKDISNIDFLA